MQINYRIKHVCNHVPYMMFLSSYNTGTLEAGMKTKKLYVGQRRPNRSITTLLK